MIDFDRYREVGASEWSTMPVTPSGSTQVTINRLTPCTTYEFQVIGKNALGDGMLSKVITVRTQGWYLFLLFYLFVAIFNEFLKHKTIYESVAK